MTAYAIRVIGDPVLRQRAAEVTEVDGKVATLAHDMFDAMYAAPGIGLAAPQVGVRKRIFVYDTESLGPGVLINPRIVGYDGEWVYNEGCLSIPNLYFEIVRPRTVAVQGFDLDGEEVELELDELAARLIQHELDHLDGVLMVERLSEEQRTAAKKALRDLMLDGDRTRGPATTFAMDGSVVD